MAGLQERADNATRSSLVFTQELNPLQFYWDVEINHCRSYT